MRPDRTTGAGCGPGEGYPNSALSGKRLGLLTSQAFSVVNFRAPLVRDWLACGAEVYAFAPDYDPDTREAVTALGAIPVDFRLARATIAPFADVRDALILARLLRRYQIDLTFAYFIKPVIYGGLAARLARIGHRFAMVEGAGYVFSEDHPGASGIAKSLLRAAVTLLYRVGLNGVDKVFFLNQDDVALFRTRSMVAPCSVVLSGAIGVDLGAFPASLPPPVKPITFLLAARLIEHKGVREFVAAATRLRDRHPDVRWIVLGSPDLNPASIPESELSQWHRDGIIEWQAHVSDVRPWMRRASVFVLPSWYREGVPRSIQEAMATGRPVITTDMPGCRDTVVHGESGLLVPPRDVEALCAAMEQFIDNPDQISRMGQAARLRAEALFDARRTNRLIIAHMEEAYSQEGQEACEP